MKLNLEKCAFGISSGKRLGFLVSHRGIEVNPYQIKAIDRIPEQLTTKKQVQRLIGRIVALSRFISWSSDRCHRFLGILKKDNRLEWSHEYAQALQELKSYLSSPPLLKKPKHRDYLLVYLPVSEVAVSAVLVPENKGTQSPINYISKTLVNTKMRYPYREKLDLALVIASRKLRPYF